MKNDALAVVHASSTPTMNADKIIAIIGDVTGVADRIMGLLQTSGFKTGGVEQGVALLDLFAELAQKGVAAWHEAAGIPITADSIAALLPDATPLNPPTVEVPPTATTSTSVASVGDATHVESHNAASAADVGTDVSTSESNLQKGDGV